MNITAYFTRSYTHTHTHTNHIINVKTYRETEQVKTDNQRENLKNRKSTWNDKIIS